MRKNIPVFLLLVIAPAVFIVSCQSLERLRPALTIAAITILQELDLLLVEYESATISNPATGTEILIFQASQLTLHRTIENRIASAAHHVPTKTLESYRARLDAVPWASPRAD